MRKILTLIAALSLVASLAIGGSIAYLQDTDEDVNVMTLGNVYIDQHEYERKVGADGKYVTDTIDNQTSYVLKDFTQAKPLYPAVIPNGGTVNGVTWDYDSIPVRMSQVGSHGGASVFNTPNAVDKFVTVENTGKSDAYVRTLVAFEVGTATLEDEANYPNQPLISAEIRAKNADGNQNGAQPWTYGFSDYVEIDGNKYLVYELIYTGAMTSSGWKHENGVLPAGETTYPNLCQVYMASRATNEDVKALDGNDNGTYDILVLSQAVQTNGFASAKNALDTAFGEANATNVAKWFGSLTFPSIYSWDDIDYVTEGDTVSAISRGGTTVCRGILSDGKTNASNVVIGEGITRLDNRALCKAPTITSVSLPNSLTYIDESAFQQSAIKEIVVPENVTNIGKQAFGACGSLEKIVINAKNVSIANYVARACANLKEVVINSDSVTFEEGSMYFTNKENADTSGITFYVKNQAMADVLYNAFSTSHSYGMLIKSIDGATTYYNTLK